MNPGNCVCVSNAHGGLQIQAVLITKNGCAWRIRISRNYKFAMHRQKRTYKTYGTDKLSASRRQLPDEYIN